MCTSLGSLIKQMNRTHPDSVNVGGWEQGATSVPRRNHFLLVTELGEVGEACSEAQDTSYTHHVQNPPAWKRDNTWVHRLYWERHLSTFLLTGVTVSRVNRKETNATAAWDMWWHHYRVWGLHSSSFWTSVRLLFISINVGGLFIKQLCQIEPTLK